MWSGKSLVKNANYSKTNVKIGKNLSFEPIFSYNNYTIGSNDNAIKTDEKVTIQQEKNNENKKKPSFFKRIIFFLLLIIFSPFLIIGFIIKKIAKRVKRKKWEKDGLRGKLLLLNSDISDIDIMEGYEFENYLKTLFFYEGYVTEVTSKAKDFGADIILTKANEKIVVQAKRYNKSVGAKSVQEIIGGAKHYNATDAMVVTNSHFTSAAETIAKENNIRLIDREELIEIYIKVKKQLQLSTKESELVDKKDIDLAEKFPYMI